MAMFVYSAYWRKWSRLLLNEFDNQCVELDLEPVNVSSAAEWERIKQQNIRRHRTPRVSGDKVSTQLPAEVLSCMRQHLSETCINALLTYDYLPEIDWALYDKVSNGGAPFEKVRQFNKAIS